MPVDLKLVSRNYEIIAPLAMDDVKPDGVNLELDRTTPMSRFREDQSFQAGELSFSQYVRLLAEGNTELVGVPVFLMRGFRQRCFFVRTESGLTSFSHLAGTRIGTNGWPDSGNTWSRALIREAGVDIGDIQWTVATLDGVTDQIYGHRVSAPNAPANVPIAPEGTTLVDLLLNDELDAMMVPWPPRVMFDANSPVRRLFPDYRAIEEEYAARVGFYPSHHILGIRANIVDEHPWVVRSLFDAFEESRKQSEARCQVMLDTVPWLQEELEQIHRILGPNWQAHGVAPNRDMIATFVNELHAQGIISTPIEPSRIFGQFEELMATH
jgi:4,5-dihydroxyphthalate decarboxylase